MPHSSYLLFAHPPSPRRRRDSDFAEWFVLADGIAVDDDVHAAAVAVDQIAETSMAADEASVLKSVMVDQSLHTPRSSNSEVVAPVR